MTFSQQPWHASQPGPAQHRGGNPDRPPEPVRLPPCSSLRTLAPAFDGDGYREGGQFDPVRPFAAKQHREGDSHFVLHRQSVPKSNPPTSQRTSVEGPHRLHHLQDHEVGRLEVSSNMPYQPYFSEPTPRQAMGHPAYTAHDTYGAPAIASSADAHHAKVAIPFTPESLRASNGRPKIDPALKRVKVEDEQGGEATKPVPRPSATSLDILEGTRPPDELAIYVRQQPAAARSCGHGDADRRTIDPPPILQLTVNNPSLSPEEVRDRLQYPFYVVHCSIVDKTGEEDCTYMPTEHRRNKRLMGNLTAGPFVGKDEFGIEGCFFPFPDLSVRTPGEYRLKFNFVRLEPQRGKPGRSYSITSTALSDVFVVSPAKEFRGMVASSPLARSLKRQGCFIAIRGGDEKRKTARKRQRVRGEESSDESDGSDSDAPRKKGGLKGR